MAKYNGKLVMADVQERLLCFEYLPKGNVHDYITGREIILHAAITIFVHDRNLLPCYYCKPFEDLKNRVSWPLNALSSLQMHLLDLNGEHAIK
jgi:hypothetical protein